MFVADWRFFKRLLWVATMPVITAMLVSALFKMPVVTAMIFTPFKCPPKMETGRTIEITLLTRNGAGPAGVAGAIARSIATTRMGLQGTATDGARRASISQR